MLDVVKNESTPDSTYAGLVDRLDALPASPDWPYDEPDDLAAIQTATGPLPATAPQDGDARRRDRVRGAWLGRSAGCLVGKPMEGWSSVAIDHYLTVAGALPLVDYVQRIDPEPLGYRFNGVGAVGTFTGEIDGMARDDDLDYTVLALLLAERHGPDVRTEDFGAAWLELLPFHQVYTAERTAMRNLVAGLEPPRSATWRNPYREWIGALIRADLWGYVLPGDPRRASEFAYRDARLSHTANGIYGAMWSAALLASAFGSATVEEAVERSVHVVPPASRLREALDWVVAAGRDGAGWSDVLAAIQERYAGMSGIHTINNAAIIAAALLWGEGDFTRSVGFSATAGWDTDSNGATVGSTVGAVLGAEALPAHWVDPLGDRLHSALFGHAVNSISDLADRMVAQRARFGRS